MNREFKEREPEEMPIIDKIPISGSVAWSVVTAFGAGALSIGIFAGQVLSTERTRVEMRQLFVDMAEMAKTDKIQDLRLDAIREQIAVMQQIMQTNQVTIADLKTSDAETGKDLEFIRAGMEETLESLEEIARGGNK
jgi:hypothetical protein